METLTTLTLGEIVKKQYRAAEVFEKFGLDFCCMGSQTLAEACSASQRDPAEVTAALQALEAEGSDGVNFDTWPLDLLADYIYQRHHHYVEEKTPIIQGYLDKICAVHGNRHPELHEIRRIFQETSGALAVHMKKEELMLFPYIKRLAKARESHEPVSSPIFGSISNPIHAMKDDHLDEGQQLQKMAALSNDYTPPADACSTYTVTYKMLKDYEKDMHLHIHLENNILFAKAVQLEEALNEPGAA
ncbi:iron-sulfur cluster repair di-iron protein [Fulvivirgaceae bacterium PWU5]|uniref:Iron-sulfur cluster repair di-iron protein n=1 Tax=Dawidia cretensis TaxID=2782350 RepID=A0AAP2GUN1_9BACT|nr:iron-sulfur cluster repair di-iron protein [Dawidia cretensis]MBT1709753.1 iron-sulfur cluster repair di-iron protein [Dawidia cretensis]